MPEVAAELLPAPALEVAPPPLPPGRVAPDVAAAVSVTTASAACFASVSLVASITFVWFAIAAVLTIHGDEVVFVVV